MSAALSTTATYPEGMLDKRDFGAQLQQRAHDYKDYGREEENSQERCDLFEVPGSYVDPYPVQALRHTQLS